MLRVLSLFVALAAFVEATTFRSKVSRHLLKTSKDSGNLLVKTKEFKHRLRVCNAYPYSAALDIFRGQSEKLTADTPLPYKGCRDFKSLLKVGDKLEFMVGDANAGTFSVADLPNNDAVLFLAIYRHDMSSTAVSFESHVFANLLNAQVAVIDTYKGSKKSVLKIEDSGVTPRTEDLRFESVVAVNPGKYSAVLLDDKSEHERTRKELVTLNRESYVVMRVGVEAKDGESFPEDIVVYPHSDASLLSFSGRTRSVSAALLSVVGVFWLVF